MKYNGKVDKKLSVIEEQVRLVESWNITSFAALQENVMLQYAVERALHVAVEAMIDTGERILAVAQQPPAINSAEVIRRLQSLGIISANQEYEDMVRFRNFIVHRYENIDLAVIYNIVKNKLPLFRLFVDEIRNAYK